MQQSRLPSFGSALVRLALLVTFALTIVIAGASVATADCVSDKGCYCGDGNCPTLGCCGGEGERVCITNTAFSDCDSACNPGYEYDSTTANCELPCKDRKGCWCGDGNCPTLGCCGDEGQRPCITGPSSDCSAACMPDLENAGGCRDLCPDRSGGDSCDPFGDCGQSYERVCSDTASCGDGYFYDSADGPGSYIGTAFCQPEFIPPSSPPESGFDFTFYVVNDVHVSDTERGDCYPEEAYGLMTKFVNDAGGSGLKWPAEDGDGTAYLKAGLAIGKPLAIVMAGDMTSRGKDSAGIENFSNEFTWLRDYWDERREDDEHTPSIDFPVYPGQGNHDLLECGDGDDLLECAVRKDVKNSISNGYMKERMGGESSINFDEDTSNYSWDWGPIHLIQGNLWAGKFDDLEWLKQDLEDNVGTSGRPVILFQHYGWDSFSTGAENWWSEDNRTDLVEALADYNVIGIFTGHTHNNSSKRDITGASYKNYTGEDGGNDRDADCTDAKGDGGFLAVHLKDVGGGNGKLEVLQVLWDGSTTTTAADMTFDTDSGVSSASHARGFRVLPAPPVARCKDGAILAANASCERTITAADIDNGSADPDGTAATITYDPPLGTVPARQEGYGYSLTITSGGESDTCTTTLNVFDQTGPTVTPTGTNPQTLECPAAYTESGATATDNCSGDVTASIVTSGTVDNTTPGAYTVTYKAKDAANNEGTGTRTVNVADTTDPVVTVTGADPATAQCGVSGVVDPGATATDTCAGDVTASIVTSGSVDFGKPGSYTLTYTATDSAANTGADTRTVNVVDTIAPTLTILGANPATAECAVAFSDPGATATDACAGDLTSRIAKDTVSTAAVGSQTITYRVNDGANAQTAQRTVNVVDTTDPVLTLNGANPMSLECTATFTDPGATATDTCAGTLTSSIVTTGTVDEDAPGANEIKYEVTDGYNPVDETRTVNVVDTTPPDVEPTTQAIWLSKNHKMESFVTDDFVLSASDACDETITRAAAVVSQVTSDEPHDAPDKKDGQSPDDIVIAEDCKAVELRAERSTLGDGRVYEVTSSVEDASGNSANVLRDVVVPLRAKKQVPPAVQGQTVETETCP